MFFLKNHLPLPLGSIEDLRYFYIPIVEKFSNIEQSIANLHLWRYAQAPNIYRHLYPSLAAFKTGESNRPGNLLCYKVGLNNLQYSELVPVQRGGCEIYRASFPFTAKKINSCISIINNNEVEYNNPFYEQSLQIEETPDISVA